MWRSGLSEAVLGLESEMVWELGLAQGSELAKEATRMTATELLAWTRCRYMRVQKQ
jgi:hypothetical protein